MQVAFTRAEEFFYDTFDPASHREDRSAMDDGGKITLWDYDVYFAGDRAAELFYDVPNARMRVFGGSARRGRTPTASASAPGARPGRT